MRALQNSSLFFLCAVLLVNSFGCATTRQKTEQTEAVSAAGKVLTAMSGQKIDEKRLRELEREIQSDPEAKSAVEAIANSVSARGPVIKYCPVCGQRYSAKFKDCPIDSTPLKVLDE